MKKIIALLTVITLLLGAVSIPVAAADTLDDHLITHWDFAGDSILADKATSGASSDTMKIFGACSFENGTAFIPDWSNECSDHYLYASDSADLMRTTADRTIFIVFKSSKGDFANDDKTDSIELVGQNGALRVGIGADNNKLFASTNPSALGENWAMTDGMNTFVKDTWTTVALSYDKQSDGKFTINSYYKAGDGEWVSGTVNWTDTVQTWVEDNIGGMNNLIFGRKAGQSASTWGGDLTFDDIRIYDKALTLNEVKTIEITNPAPTSKVTNKGHSLTLGADIAVNFYIAIDDSIKDTATVKLTKNETEVMSTTFKANNFTDEAGGSYKYTVGVLAKEMTDTLMLKVYDGDSKEIYSDEYSVREYADYILMNTTEYTANTVYLVKAMLNYGAHSQILSGYKTDSLANAGYNLVLSDVASTGLKARVSGSIDGVKFKEAVLELDDNFAVTFNFEITEDKKLSDVNFAGVDSFENEGGTLELVTEMLCPQNFASEQVVMITVSGQRMCVAYSPMAYVEKMLTSEDANVVNFAKAIYDYGVASAAYIAG